jgi:hypothetical protein
MKRPSYFLRMVFLVERYSGLRAPQRAFFKQPAMPPMFACLSMPSTYPSCDIITAVALRWLPSASAGHPTDRCCPRRMAAALARAPYRRRRRRRPTLARAAAALPPAQTEPQAATQATRVLCPAHPAAAPAALHSQPPHPHTPPRCCPCGPALSASPSTHTTPLLPLRPCTLSLPIHTHHPAAAPLLAVPTCLACLPTSLLTSRGPVRTGSRRRQSRGSTPRCCTCPSPRRRLRGTIGEWGLK